MKYSKFVSTKHNNIFKRIYHVLSQLKADGKPAHTTEELLLKFHVCYPILSASDAEALSEILVQLASLQVDVAQADELFRVLKQRKQAEELALTAVSVAAGDRKFEELLQSFKQLEDIPLVEENPFVTDSILEIAAKNLAEPPYQFRLRTLNKILGGLRKRTFGFIFARPEIGKTQFLASEATFLAPQTENGILWVNNEEDGLTLVPRCYQATLLKDSEWIYANTKEAEATYKGKINGKIRIYDRPLATEKDVEAVVRNIRPDIVFIDQLDKLRGFSGADERNDLKLKAKYQWARELAKSYNCAVIGICQAGGTGENKRYLDMNDVDSSHTAKQGEADWMFGIGSTDRAGEEDRRFISVCKNKLPQSPGMVSGMRHAKIPIKSVPELQIYEDAMNV